MQPPRSKSRMETPNLFFQRVPAFGWPESAGELSRPVIGILTNELSLAMDLKESLKSEILRIAGESLEDIAMVVDVFLKYWRDTIPQLKYC